MANADLNDFKKSAKPSVLITGASAGIGAALASVFAREGFPLLLTARRKERLHAVATECARLVPVKTFVFDVQSKTSVLDFVKENSQWIETAEILINNAGLALGTEKIQDGDIEQWETMLDTNVKGLLYMTRQVAPFFLKKKRGHIVNLGSVAGRWLYPGGAVYCASKFAVRALSEGLRMDLHGSGIRVSNIEPGMVETEFSVVRLGSQEKADKVYAGMQPLTANDIAETIFWVTNRPQHINIQELVIYPTDQAHVGMVHRKT